MSGKITKIIGPDERAESQYVLDLDLAEGEWSVGGERTQEQLTESALGEKLKDDPSAEVRVSQGVCFFALARITGVQPRPDRG